MQVDGHLTRASKLGLTALRSLSVVELAQVL